jgi:hypothetical protein
VHRRNSRSLELALEPQVEVGGVDADEKARPRREEPPPELSPDPVDFQKMPQHFDVAAHRKLLHGEPGIEALRLHLRAAYADELQSGNALAQRSDEVSSEKVPGSLPRDHAYDNGLAVHRG